MKVMRRLLVVAMLSMGTTLMAQTEKSCQEWVNQFSREVLNLKNDISRLEADAKLDKDNGSLLTQIKEKKDLLAIAQSNLSIAQQGVKDEAKADKEIAKAKSQIAKMQQKKDKGDAAVVKAEQNIVKAEQNVTKRQQEVAKAEQKLAEAKQNVTKAIDAVAKAKEDAVKAKNDVANLIDNTESTTAAVKLAEEKKAAIKGNVLQKLNIR